MFACSLVMLLTCCSHTGRLPCLPFIFIIYLCFMLAVFLTFLFHQSIKDAVFTYNCVCAFCYLEEETTRVYFFCSSVCWGKKKNEEEEEKHKYMLDSGCCAPFCILKFYTFFPCSFLLVFPIPTLPTPPHQPCIEFFGAIKWSNIFNIQNVLPKFLLLFFNVELR